MNDKVSIIIPNYNGANLLKKNIPDILARAPHTQIIIVDDASTDESVDIIRNNFPQIKLIIRTRNSGFSSAVNDGVRHADGEYIFLLNSDALPQKNFLAPLLMHFKDESVFAVGCLQKGSTWSGNTDLGRGIGNFANGFLVHSRGATGKINTLWAFGGASMFRKKMWDQLGGLDTIYNPFYWEDIDLSYRALKCGYKVLFEPKSIIYHNQEEGAIRSHHSPFYINTIAFRNQILFVWLNITDKEFLLNHFIHLPLIFLKSIIRLNLSFIIGTLWAFMKLPLVLPKRFSNIKNFRKTDISVLKTFSDELPK